MTITTPPPRVRTRAEPLRVTPARTQPSGTPAPGAQPSRTQPPRTQPRGVPPRPATVEPGSPRPAQPALRPVGGPRSAAAQRAYARRAQRQGYGAVVAAPRTPFVLLAMALLAGGLVAALWLSTAAAGDSYRLEQARAQARGLSERAEQLRQEVASLQTAPELARRARDLGMVPTGDPARLVVQPDGTVQVVGTPVPATPPPPLVPPAPPASAPPAAAQPPADGQVPAAQPPAAQDPAAQQPGNG
jgi:cell division protein FtsB